MMTVITRMIGDLSGCASVAHSKSLDSRRRSGGCTRKAEEESIAVFYGRRRERSGVPPGRRIRQATSDARALRTSEVFLPAHGVRLDYECSERVVHLSR
jgi:hypothetical protein